MAPSLVPEADLRRVVSDALARSTGHRASISGEPRIVLFPAPAVILEKVAFPMPGRMALDAQGAVARLKLLSLLTGRIEVADVTLNKPTLVVTGRSPTLAPALVSLLAGPDLPELQLTGGTIALRNGEGLTEELVSGIDARVKRSLVGGGVSAHVSFAWRDRTTTADIHIEDARAFLSGRPTDSKADIATGASWLRFRGQAAAGLTPSLTGELSGETATLRDLMKWAGAPLPLSGGFQRLSFAGTVTADPTQVQLAPITALVDGNKSEGALTLKLDGARPALEGTFAADTVDLTPYGRITMTESRDGDWDRTSLNPRPLSKFDLDLRFSAARMKVDDSVFERVATSAVLRSGHLVLALGTAQAWGGSVRAALDIVSDGTVDGTTLKFQGAGSGIAVDRAFGDLLSIRRIEGTGDVEATLQGVGHSFYEVAQSLSGTVLFQVANGSIAGIDVAQVMRRIERRPLSGGGDLRGGRTPFERLVARINLTDGVARVLQAQMSGRQVNLALDGAVDVGSRDIDLQGRAILLPSSSAERSAPFDLPFIIQGPWSSPFVMLDPRSLIERSGAAQPLLEAVRNKAPGGEAAVRSVIEQLAKPTALPPAKAAN
ncbi:MAG: AsmA family protein [Pseudomonadota bacterium]